MKRDMDLVRTLMLRLEEMHQAPRTTYTIPPDANKLTVDDTNIDKIGLHILMLINAGFIDCRRMPQGEFKFKGLTWKGHDFLDSVRDDQVWRLTKDGARQAGGWTADLLAALGKGFIKKKLEQHTGVSIDR